jgi:2-polyprenyl-3-methyl-5-hydroxy-6-metoxy-1,4-benzoquinol methylase
MPYLEKIYAEMGVKNDPPEEYFETDSRYMSIEQALRSLPRGKLCDLGCGRGLVLRRLQDHHTVYGTDFDPGAVEYCRSQGLTVERIDLNEADDLPFPNVMFDAVLISEVLEHLLEPRRAIKLIKRHLKPGGTLIVTIPNAVPLMVRFKVLFGRTADWLHYPSGETDGTGHIRFYTIESMSRLLRQEGFTVESAFGVSFRMNSKFWERVCYWLPRLMFKPSAKDRAKTDLWLGKRMPGLAAGLFFLCKNSQNS